MHENKPNFKLASLVYNPATRTLRKPSCNNVFLFIGKQYYVKD